LHQVHRGMLVHDSIVLESNEDEQAIDNSGAAGSVGSGLVESLNGADIDMFKLDGPSCIADLDRTLMRLSEQLVNEQLLGALMFSCGGRGPSKRGMMGEEMMDANHFNHHFDLPCLGFYAGGEIGPMVSQNDLTRVEVFVLVCVCWLYLFFLTRRVVFVVCVALYRQKQTTPMYFNKEKWRFKDSQWCLVCLSCQSRPPPNI
jgi:hypothetical protein